MDRQSRHDIKTKKKGRRISRNAMAKLLAAFLVAGMLLMGLSGCSGSGEESESAQSLESDTESGLEGNLEESELGSNADLTESTIGAGTSDSGSAEESGESENAEPTEDRAGTEAPDGEAGQPDAEASSEETESPEGETHEQETSETDGDSGDASETAPETDPVENPREGETEGATYTYTDMDGVLYATVPLNVRDLPSVDGQKIGELSAAQEVSVTGQCNETSWYQIDLNGQVGYVSDLYLAQQPPAMEPVASEGTGGQRESEGSTNAVAEEASAGTESTASTGLVPIDKLENRASLKKRCTDEEFQAAYDAASAIVTPLIGQSRENQLNGIFSALRAMFDSGQVTYSTEADHYNDPYGYLVKGVSSCAGCTRTTGLCLNMLGISYEHVNENQWVHQWCRVNVDGVYWICDAYGLYLGPEPAPYEHPIF